MQVFSRKSSSGGTAVIPSAEYPSSPLNRVYLIMGQSNADGTEPVSNFPVIYQQARERTYISGGNDQWVLLEPGVNNRAGSNAGFDLSLSLELESLYPQDNIYFLHLSWGSTSLDFHWDSLKGYFLATALTNAFQSIRNLTGNCVWSGILWNQGESDNDGGVNAANYKERLVRLIELLRNLFGHQIPFIASRLDAVGGVRNAVVELKDEGYPLFDWVDQDNFAKKDGGAHFLADGYIAIGERYAEKLFAFNAAEPIERSRGLQLLHQDGGETSSGFTIEIDLPHTGQIWRFNIGNYVVSGTGNLSVTVSVSNQSGTLTQLIGPTAYGAGDSKVTEFSYPIRRRDFTKLVVNFTKTSGDLVYQPFAQVQIQTAIFAESRSLQASGGVTLDTTLQAIADTTSVGFIKRLANGLVSLINPSTWAETFIQAVDAVAARTQLGFTSTGSAIATAADPAAARTAIGLGTMATQNANAVAITGGSVTATGVIATSSTTASTSTTTGAIRAVGGISSQGAIWAGSLNTTGRMTSSGAWFGGGLLNDFYAASNFFAYGGFNAASVNIVPTQERLQGALSFGTYTTTNVSNPERAINHSYDSHATISAGQTGVFEFDFTAVLSARGAENASGLDFEVGTMVVSFYNNGKPGAFTVEIFARPQAGGAWDWRNIATVANMDTAVGNYVPYILKFPANTWRSVQKVRITATALATKDCNITAIEYFPSRPVGNELLPFVTTKNNISQDIYCPSISVRSPDHSVAATVGRGYFTPHSFTVAQLQAGLTGQTAGAMAYCSNESGGPCSVIFDGTNWLRERDLFPISAGTANSRFYFDQGGYLEEDANGVIAVSGEAEVGGNLNVGGSGAFTGPISTTDTTESTSTTTGSIRGAGAGFTGNVNIGGDLQAGNIRMETYGGGSRMDVVNSDSTTGRFDFGLRQGARAECYGWNAPDKSGSFIITLDARNAATSGFQSYFRIFSYSGTNWTSIFTASVDGCAPLIPSFSSHSAAAASSTLPQNGLYRITGSQLLYSKASTAGVVVHFFDGSTLAPNANGDLVFTSKNNNSTTIALA